MLGADYPKVHEVASAFCEQARQKSGAVEESLERIQTISLWLSQARAPSLLLRTRVRRGRRTAGL